jgi:hypothetical protein
MREMIKKPDLTSYVASIADLYKTPLGLLALYFVASAILASLILLRLNGVFPYWTIRLNVFAYYLTYYIIPLISLMWLFCRIHLRAGRKLTNKVLLIILVEFLLCTFSFISVFLFTNLPDYCLLPIPLVILLLAYIVKYKPKKRNIKLTAPLLVALFVISFFAPLASATIGNIQIIDRASVIQNSEDQVRFISQIPLVTTVRIDLVRANNDFMKLLLAGDGACGEGANSILFYLKALNYSVREVGFPGEDHAFVEVKMNGTWMVIDPGYSVVLGSEESRGDCRVQEAGTLTYVAAYSQNGFTELTQQYVKTDTVNLKLTQHGEPVVGASVTLVHTLVTDGNARKMELPGHGFSFHSDLNGMVTLHLGRIGLNVYNNSFTKTDSYYIINVNGKAIAQTVTSTGTGLVNNVTIDLGGF